MLEGGRGLTKAEVFKFTKDVDGMRGEEDAERGEGPLWNTTGEELPEVVRVLLGP